MGRARLVGVGDWQRWMLQVGFVSLQEGGWFAMSGVLS